MVKRRLEISSLRVGFVLKFSKKKIDCRFFFLTYFHVISSTRIQVIRPSALVPISLNFCFSFRERTFDKTIEYNLGCDDYNVGFREEDRRNTVSIIGSVVAALDPSSLQDRYKLAEPKSLQ